MFLLNPAEITVNHVCYQCLISQSVFKIFAFKVESCPKSGQIFEFLALPSFWGAGPPKNLYLSNQAHLKARHVAKFLGVLPLPQKLEAQICQILSQFLTPLEKNC